MATVTVRLTQQPDGLIKVVHYGPDTHLVGTWDPSILNMSFSTILHAFASPEHESAPLWRDKFGEPAPLGFTAEVGLSMLYLLAPTRAQQSYLSQQFSNQHGRIKLEQDLATLGIDLPFELASLPTGDGSSPDAPMTLERVAIVRTLPGVDRNDVSDLPLEIALIGANPWSPNYPKLDGLDRTIEELAKALSGLEFAGLPVKVNRSDNATYKEIMEFGRRAAMVIFIGHGRSLDQGGGVVIGTSSDLQELTPKQFSDLFPNARLVIAACCHGADLTADSDTSLVATLSRDFGLPAALAFNGRVNWDRVRTMLPAMIGALLEHGDVDRAVFASRQAVSLFPAAFQLRVFQRSDASPFGVDALARPEPPTVPEEIRGRVEAPGSDLLVRRRSVEDELSNFLKDVKAPLAAVVAGDPGSGKTSFLVTLIDSMKTTESILDATVVHAHWCDHRNSRTKQPKTLIIEWATSLEKQLPAFAKALHREVDQGDRSASPQRLMKDSENAIMYCERIVLSPLRTARKNGLQTTVILLVDALDETLAGEGGSRAITEFLAELLINLKPSADSPLSTSGVRVIATSRVDIPLRKSVDRHEIHLSEPVHAADVAAWTQAQVESVLKPIVARGLLDQTAVSVTQQAAISRINGNFLISRSIVRQITDAVETAQAAGVAPNLDSSTWPESLSEAFERDLSRVSTNDELQQILCIIAVAGSAGVPTQIVADALDLDWDAVGNQIERAAYYIANWRARSGDRQTWQLFHLAFAEHVKSHGVIKAPGAHLKLARLIEHADFSWADADPYLVTTGAVHLAAATTWLRVEMARGRTSMFRTLSKTVFDIEWIERRVCLDGPTALLDDLLLAKETGVTNPPE